MLITPFIYSIILSTPFFHNPQKRFSCRILICHVLVSHYRRLCTIAIPTIVGWAGPYPYLLLIEIKCYKNCPCNHKMQRSWATSVDDPWDFEQHEVEELLLHQGLILSDELLRIFTFLSLGAVGSGAEIREVGLEDIEGLLGQFRFRLKGVFC